MRKICLILFFLFFAGVAYSQNFSRTANGELILRAIHHCFPGKAGDVAFIDNDWTITADGETFYWAGGRLLPASEKENADSWEPHFFGLYPEQVPSPTAYPPQYIEILRNRGSEQARPDYKDSHRGLQAILYGGLERPAVESKLERINFLGETISVHQDIADALRRVDAEILKWNGSKAFIDSLASVGAYNWREIAGTRRMSYHSWGLAVDILPKRLGGKSIYWLWERRRNAEWMTVPLNSRWNPPDEVIAAFEREGFIWGGKWPFYDNMHFEWRPELHEFNRLLAAVPEPAAPINSHDDLHHIFPDLMTK